MAFKIIISDEAKTDLEHTYLYYRTKAGKRVADQFFKAFESSINIISKNPYFKIWFDDFRAKPMKNILFCYFM